MFRKLFELLFNRKKYTEVNNTSKNTYKENNNKEKAIKFNVDTENKYRFYPNNCHINTKHKFYKLVSEDSLELYVRMVFNGVKKVPFSPRYLNGLNVTTFSNNNDNGSSQFNIYIKLSSIFNRICGYHKLDEYPVNEIYGGELNGNEFNRAGKFHKIEITIPYDNDTEISAFLLIPDLFFDIDLLFDKYFGCGKDRILKSIKY
jgi:hypothetical protein